MNLAGFKKMKEDKKMVTMGHPSGHSITILKSQLPTFQRKQLEKLPLHLAAGTDEPLDSKAEEDPGIKPESPSIAQQIGSAANNFVGTLGGNALAKGYQNMAEEDKASSMPDAGPSIIDGQKAGPPIATTGTPPEAAMPISGETSGNAPAATKPSADNGLPLGVLAGGDEASKYYKGAQQAIKDTAQVNARIDAAKLDASQAHQLDIQDLNAKAQENQATFQKERDNFNKYQMEHPIDEKHYVESMGTGRKISTAIGLMLGGFYAGYSKTGVNPAMDFLNKQIDRDIEGQKSRMDQQKTIFGANHELYRDQVLAQNATRINMNDIYSQKIQEAALKEGTPAALNAAKLAQFELAKNSQDLLDRSTIRSTVLQGLKSGNSAVDPAALGAGGFMRPEQATKEQAAYDGYKNAAQSGDDLYKGLLKTDTLGNWVTSPLSTNKSIDLMNSQLGSNLQQAAPSKRLSDTVAAMQMKPFYITLSDNAQDVENKRIGYQNRIRAEFANETPNFSRLVKTHFGETPIEGSDTAKAAAKYKVGSILKDPKTGQNWEITDVNGGKKMVK